jgi:hypothetical protein
MRKISGRVRDLSTFTIGVGSHLKLKSARQRSSRNSRTANSPFIGRQLAPPGETV